TIHNRAASDLWKEHVLLPVSQWGQIKAWRDDPDTGSALEDKPLGQPLDWPLARALNDGRAVLGSIVHVEFADGARRVIRESAIPLLDVDGVVTGAVSVCEDITQLRRSEAELRQAKESAEAANRLKDEFLAVVSHE